jgi:hypothetical protein
MGKQQTLWIHPASYTFSPDAPEKLMETVWAERPGWGYMRRRDLWIEKVCTIEEMQAQGYVLKKPVDGEEVQLCPHCGMYICSIPGALLQKHRAECKGGHEEWKILEDALIQDQRRRNFEAEIMAARLREQEEQELAGKRERFDRIREEQVTRQEAKDRKKRLRRETREELRRR